MLAILPVTDSVLLGVLALTGRPAGDGGSRVPRFVTQNLHRNLALGSVLLLLAHIVTAVADEFVDIRWWQALVPFGATYAPLWLELGTVAFDLMIVVTVTSLLRHRLGVRSWRAVHLTSWAAYVAAVVHGFGIGTDLRHRDHCERKDFVRILNEHLCRKSLRMREVIEEIDNCEESDDHAQSGILLEPEAES